MGATWTQPSAHLLPYAKEVRAALDRYPPAHRNRCSLPGPAEMGSALHLQAAEAEAILLRLRAGRAKAATGPRRSARAESAGVYPVAAARGEQVHLPERAQASPPVRSGKRVEVPPSAEERPAEFRHQGAEAQCQLPGERRRPARGQSGHSHRGSLPNRRSPPVDGCACEALRAPASRCRRAQLPVRSADRIRTRNHPTPRRSTRCHPEDRGIRRCTAGSTAGAVPIAQNIRS